MVPTRETPSVPVPVSSDPSDDVEMDEPPPVPEPMDTSLLVNFMFDEVENAFLRGTHVEKVNKTLNKGETVWFQTKLFGRVVWQSMNSREICETTGAILDQEKLKKAIILEFDQLSVLKVGSFLGYRDASHKAEANGVRIIPTRWVLSRNLKRCVPGWCVKIIAATASRRYVRTYTHRHQIWNR